MSERDGKRYYWLKLKEDFFDDDAISWLEEQENGKEYTLFYLKLCLKSLQYDGILIRHVGKMLVPFETKKLAELTNTKEDTVMIALTLLQKIGLVEVMENGALYLSQVNKMVGSETNSAVRKRLYRARLNGENVLPPSRQEVPAIESPAKDTAQPQEKKPNKFEERFEEFWKHYPRKIGKGAAKKSFVKRKPSQELTQRMINAVEIQKKSPQWMRDKGQFIPHPTTWLNQERWEDEVEVVNNAPQKSSRPVGGINGMSTADYMRQRENKRQQALRAIEMAEANAGGNEIRW